MDWDAEEGNGMKKAMIGIATQKAIRDRALARPREQEMAARRSRRLRGGVTDTDSTARWLQDLPRCRHWAYRGSSGLRVSLDMASC